MYQNVSIFLWIWVEVNYSLELYSQTVMNNRRCMIEQKVVCPNHALGVFSCDTIRINRINMSTREHLQKRDIAITGFTAWSIQLEFANKAPCGRPMQNEKLYRVIFVLFLKWRWTDPASHLLHDGITHKTGSYRYIIYRDIRNKTVLCE